jgi:hypothetical protein
MNSHCFFLLVFALESDSTVHRQKHEHQSALLSVHNQFSTYAGFIVNLNPKKDCNCQFEAVADQLRLRVHLNSDGSQSYQTSATAAVAVTGMIDNKTIGDYLHD